MGRALVVEEGVAPKSAVAAAVRWEIKGRREIDLNGSVGLQRGVETLWLAL